MGSSQPKWRDLFEIVIASAAKQSQKYSAAGCANLEQGQNVQFDTGQGKKESCATNVITA